LCRKWENVLLFKTNLNASKEFQMSYLTIGLNSSSALSLSDNATSSHFGTHHEGSLQVPIPCAVLNVVFITILIIIPIALSGGSKLHEFSQSLLATSIHTQPKSTSFV
jgi:hypothetical protein